MYIWREIKQHWADGQAMDRWPEEETAWGGSQVTSAPVKEGVSNGRCGEGDRPEKALGLARTPRGHGFT